MTPPKGDDAVVAAGPGKAADAVTKGGKRLSAVKRHRAPASSPRDAAATPGYAAACLRLAPKA